MLGSFFKKNLVGLYFSARGFVIVQQTSGKIVNQFYAPYPYQRDVSTAVLSDDVFSIFKDKEMELVAFLQKAIRDSRIEISQVIVALPPKDLIIRFFEMPNIPRSEIQSGINFEMKKYIPFKIEELAYDFQYRVKQKANIIEVVLCGIKQDPIDKYAALFKQLNLTVSAFEPGLFSLFRLLVLKNKILSTRSYVILEFDMEEANILIAERGFPYFTRDIRLVTTTAAAKPSEEFDVILFRLINEVRVSLDYYRRQFMKRDVDEMIIISSKTYSSWVDHFSKELGIKVIFIALDDLLKIKESKDELLSGVAKAYGAALKVEKPQLVTLNLIKSKEKMEKAAASAAGVATENLETSIINFINESKTALIRGLIAGIIILVLGYGAAYSKLFPLEKKLSTVAVQQFPLLPGVDVSTLESVQESEKNFLQKERDISKIMTEYAPFYKKIILLSNLMPEGVWLSQLSYTSSPFSMTLKCYSYADDERMRSDNINKFIISLKENKEFSKESPIIELKSYREVTGPDYTYMQFDVMCEKKG